MMIDRLEIFVYRLLVLMLVTISTSVSSVAFDRWYEPAVDVAEGTYVEGRIEGDVLSVNLHLRVALQEGKPAQWGLAWAYKGHDEMDRVLVSMPTHARTDAMYPSAVKIEVQRMQAGVVTVIDQVDANGFDTEGGFNSLVVNYSDGMLRIIGGASAAQRYIEMPYDMPSGEIAVIANAPLRCQRLRIDTESRAQSRSRFATYDDLVTYLSTSEDAVEGIWEYLDRRTTPSKAEIGGRYRLAVVRNADHYDIVYLSGAESASSSWRALDLKGRLTPTAFVGNYDLEWIDASGASITGDSNAQLSDDHAILSLRLPDIGAELRFSRE